VHVLLKTIILIVASELPIQYALSNGPPMPYCKYDLQSVLDNSICKVCCDRAITGDSLDIVILDKTKEEETYTMDVAVRNSSSLHSAITKKLL